MDDQFTEEYCKGKMEQIISRLGEALGSATSLYQYLEAIQQRNARIAELENFINTFGIVIKRWVSKGNIEPMWYDDFMKVANTIYGEEDKDG